MQDYTTTGTIQMPSFVSVEVAKAARGSNALQARVQAIDDSAEDEVSMVRWNAREYITHMTALNDELSRAWNNEERVKALKMAIENARMLSTTSVPQFYPSLFVLVTEILDTFGRLVFERIKQKGLTPQGKLKTRVQDFGPRDVTEEARETCKNWFYKVASIRELVPRLYMEMAIIRCNQFLYGYAEFDDALQRLAMMTRGIGDPLVGIYARSYLVRKCHDIDPSLQAPVRQCFVDSVALLRHANGDYWRAAITSQGTLSMDGYLRLWRPCWDWILHVHAQGAAGAETSAVLREYAAVTQGAAGGAGGLPGSAEVLESVLVNMPPKFLSPVADKLVLLIVEETQRDPAGRHMHLFGVLGKCLLAAAPAAELLRPLLNEIWKHVTNVADVVTYVSIAKVYVEFVTKYLGEREINVMLSDVLRHVADCKQRSNPELQEHLRDCALGLVRHYQDFHKICALETFMPFLDLVQGASQVAVHTELLRLYTKSAPPAAGGGGQDPIVVHTAFTLAKSVHDAIDSTTSQETRRDSSALLVGFLARVDFGQDFEQHLNFLVDCRRFLATLDDVTRALTMAVLQVCAATCVSKCVSKRVSKRVSRRVSKRVSKRAHHGRAAACRRDLCL